VQRFYLKNISPLLILLLVTIACVKVDLSSPPPPVVLPATGADADGAVPLPAPTATAIIWPTLAPRPTPVVMPVAFSTPAPSCPVPLLPQGRHISAGGSYTVTESITAGRMLCHIKPDSCAYDLMVGRIDPTVIYKQEETPPFNAEDFMIHPGMVQPLLRLNELVRAEWRGAVQLRITDAYDSLLSHDPPESEPKTRYSLHYEGRALDFTTWPVDRSLYPRLCALAQCAGFDWVHNEGSHCHASIKAASLCTQCGK